MLIKLHTLLQVEKFFVHSVMLTVLTASAVSHWFGWAPPGGSAHHHPMAHRARGERGEHNAVSKKFLAASLQGSSVLVRGCKPQKIRFSSMHVYGWF